MKKVTKDVLTAIERLEMDFAHQARKELHIGDDRRVTVTITIHDKLPRQLFVTDFEYSLTEQDWASLGVVLSSISSSEASPYAALLLKNRFVQFPEGGEKLLMAINGHLRVHTSPFRLRTFGSENRGSFRKRTYRVYKVNPAEPKK